MLQLRSTIVIAVWLSSNVASHPSPPALWTDANASPISVIEKSILAHESNSNVLSREFLAPAPIHRHLFGEIGKGLTEDLNQPPDVNEVNLPPQRLIHEPTTWGKATEEIQNIPESTSSPNGLSANPGNRDASLSLLEDLAGIDSSLALVGQEHRTYNDMHSDMFQNLKEIFLELKTHFQQIRQLVMACLDEFGKKRSLHQGTHESGVQGDYPPKLPNSSQLVPDHPPKFPGVSFDDDDKHKINVALQQSPNLAKNILTGLADMLRSKSIAGDDSIIRSQRHLLSTELTWQICLFRMIELLEKNHFVAAKTAQKFYTDKANMQRVARHLFLRTLFDGHHTTRYAPTPKFESLIRFPGLVYLRQGLENLSQNDRGVLIYYFLVGFAALTNVGAEYLKIPEETTLMQLVKDFRVGKSLQGVPNVQQMKGAVEPVMKCVRELTLRNSTPRSESRIAIQNMLFTLYYFLEIVETHLNPGLIKTLSEQKPELEQFTQQFTLLQYIDKLKEQETRLASFTDFLWYTKGARNKKNKGLYGDYIKEYLQTRADYYSIYLPLDSKAWARNQQKLMISRKRSDKFKEIWINYYKLWDTGKSPSECFETKT